MSVTRFDPVPSCIVLTALKFHPRDSASHGTRRTPGPHRSDNAAVANPEHLAILKEGVAEWNHWRAACREEKPDLREADLRMAHLFGANLSRANLTGADLSQANLRGANLSRAVLSEATYGHRAQSHMVIRPGVHDLAPTHVHASRLECLLNRRQRRIKQAFDLSLCCSIS
jgi:hypothetical protein